MTILEEEEELLPVTKQLDGTFADMQLDGGMDAVSTPPTSRRSKRSKASPVKTPGKSVVVPAVATPEAAKMAAAIPGLRTHVGSSFGMLNVKEIPSTWDAAFTFEMLILQMQEWDTDEIRSDWVTRGHEILLEENSETFPMPLDGNLVIMGLLTGSVVAKVYHDYTSIDKESIEAMDDVFLRWKAQQWLMDVKPMPLPARCDGRAFLGMLSCACSC
ncbi:MAG: hypothetical protein SGARI_002921 [Bacillariaceae sp.]